MQLTFILGPNRTGTNMLMSLLSGHPDLFVTDIEDFMLEGLIRGGDEIEQSLKVLGRHKLYRALAYYTDFLKPHIMTMKAGAEAYPEFDRYFFEILEQTEGPHTIPGMMAAFYQGLAMSRGQAERGMVIAKPGRGADHFFDAQRYFRTSSPRLLCTMRDPRAVINSTLARDPQSNIAVLAEDWRRHQAAVAALRQSFPVHEVRYEALCLQPEAEMKVIAAFLEIEYDPSLIDPQRRDAEYGGNSSFGALGGGISVESVERWRSTLAAGDKRRIEDLLGVEMAASGYAPDHMPSALTRLGRQIRALFARMRGQVGQIIPTSRQGTFMVGIVIGTIVGIGLGLLAFLLMLK